jgi:hypothetical protein
MEFYEEAVMHYLTANQKTFVIPQFSIGNDGEWSRPDFVALNIPDKICYIVEVSAAYDLKRLVEKVHDKENQWINELKFQLESTRVADKNWTYEIRIFVRNDRIEWFGNAVASMPDVKVRSLEDTLTPWNWPDHDTQP